MPPLEQPLPKTALRLVSPCVTVGLHIPCSGLSRIRPPALSLDFAAQPFYEPL